MARAFNISVFTCRTNLSMINYSKTGIENTACYCNFSTLVGFIGNDFNNTPASDFIWVGDAKLDSDNSVPHSYSISVLSLDRSVF